MLTVVPINVYDGKSGTNCYTWPHLSFRSQVSTLLSKGSLELIVCVCLCLSLILLFSFSL
jgi:hypothetical protein